MLYLNSRFVALKMVMKGSKVFKDKHGNPVKTEGEYIQFADGKYETEDKKEIAFIEKYMKKHQGEITVIDKRELKKQELANAKRIVAEAEAQEKMGQDEYGKVKGSSGVDTGQPNDENLQSPGAETVVDAAPDTDPPTNTDQPAKYMNMSLKQLQKTAKKMKLNLGQDRLNNVFKLRAIIIKAVKDSETPDLTDQSDE